MNRGNMRTVLRNRVGDTNSVRFTDPQVDLQLDLSAQYVSTKLGRFENTRHNLAEFAVVGNGTDLIYPLWGVTNFSGLENIRDDENIFMVRWVDEDEFPRWQQTARHGRDEKDRIIYTIRHKTGGVWRITPGASSFIITIEGVNSTTILITATAANVQSTLEGMSNIEAGDVTVTGDTGGPWTVEFVKGALAHVELATITLNQSDMTLEFYAYLVEFTIAPGRNFTMIHRVDTPSIPTGATYDGRSYSTVPTKHHETIIQDAVIQLTGHLHGGATQFAMAQMARVDRVMETDMGIKPDPAEPRIR